MFHLELIIAYYFRQQHYRPLFLFFSSFDFSGQSELPMTGHSKTHITSDITGRCDAVFMWWDLQMDLHNDVILSCAPRWAHPTPTDMQVSNFGRGGGGWNGRIQKVCELNEGF